MGQDEVRRDVRLESGPGHGSEQLESFVADFQSKILHPVHEKRAAGNEILAIQPVALGVVRDPEWEGVVDGEVCGLGPLAENVRTFLHWVPIKLGPDEALRLCVSCGDALAQEREFACAREFYGYVSKYCEGTAWKLADSHALAAGAEVTKIGSMCLGRDEACWMARAEFGSASMELGLTLARDPHVQFSATLTKVVVHLRGVQRGMRRLLTLPKEEHDAVSWLVLEGTVLLFDWCEPLSVLGHGDNVVEFLVWCTLAMESMVNLSTTKHLPWRTRLAVATCYAFEDAGKLQSARKCAAHALKKVGELRRQEGMDPPVPPKVLQALDAAEGDLRLLNFKYAALAASAAKRPPSQLIEKGGEASAAGRAGARMAGGEAEHGLSENEVLALLGRHIPNVDGHPAALLELLGRGTQGSCSSAVAGGSLTAREASAVCKCAVSLLLLPPTKDADGAASRASAGEGAQGGGDHAATAAAGGSGGFAFPLDIDQEMQLMREMYRLGGFDEWEAMLSSTKQRLRDASREGSLDREDSRAFWFEIALWSSCRRLGTWRQKPDPPQPASRGGLKRMPPTDSDADIRHATSPSPAAAATRGNGNVAPPPDKAAAGGDRNGHGGDLVGEGTQQLAFTTEEGDSSQGRGREGGRGASAHAAMIMEEVNQEEEQLRDSLLGTRPAEMVEVQLEVGSSPGVRVNLSPLLTVVVLLRKALFGPYRHVFERRGESLLNATLAVWEPYVASLLRALDGMPAEAEIDVLLLDALLLSLETINACLSVLNADDELLRATVALRLAILQADFRGDRRKACQTLRRALAGIDKHRQGLVSHCLHQAVVKGNAGNEQTREPSGMAMASITASFHRGPGDSGGGGACTDLSVGRGTAVADMSFHELAALQLDITATLFRIELLMGRDVASQLARHQKAETAARLLARKNASKQKSSSNKASKVTFGDSEGRSDTLVGSLAQGWTITLPAADAPRRGGGDDDGDGAANALAGPNAIVCAAGAGPLLPKTAAVAEVARQHGLVLNVAASATADGRGAKDNDMEVESCPATEARLVSEFRRNPYGRAVLLATMARFRRDRRDQEELIKEAAALLRQASASEKALLGMIGPSCAIGGSHSASGTYLPETAVAGNDVQLSTQRGRRLVGTPPPAPLLLSRSHSSIELLPLLFADPAHPSPAHQQQRSRHAAEVKNEGGGVTEEGVMETPLSASNATSTTMATTAAATAAVPRHLEGTPLMEKRPRVAKVCVYGKAEGAGTGVTVGNTHFAGLGIPIPFDENTGFCDAVTIRGLTPNDSYVFAVAAFDENGELIGGGIGEACRPVETLNPLPLPLCWAQLSRTALGLGWSSLAAEAASEVYRDIVVSGTVVPAKARGGRASHPVAPGCGGGSGRAAGDGGAATGGTTTDLRDGWMATPLLDQAFHPEALDRCPRGVLQAFVQACFVLVDTSDMDAVMKARAAGGCPLEEQVCFLLSLKRLTLGCEAAVLLQDWDLVTRGVGRAYHLLLPLLQVSAMGRLLFQVLCQLHQCLSVVPTETWDAATKMTLVCLAYQITTKGHEIGEDKTARAALLDHGPECQTAVFKEAPRAARVSEGQDAQEETGREGVVPTEESKGSRKNDNPPHLALMELWMGLPGYGLMGERPAGGGASTVVPKLRKALGLDPPVASAVPSAEAGESGQDQALSSAPLSALEAVEKVMSAANEDPVKGWELLRGRAFSTYLDRARLLCRVCWIAIERGMAQQVVSWLAPGTAFGSAAADVAAAETSTGAVESGRPFLFDEADLKPLTAKVLALEGALADLGYISAAPAERESFERRAEGKAAANAGGAAGKGNNKAGVPAEREGELELEGGENNAVGGKRTGQSDESMDGGGGGEQSLDASVVSAEAAEQLLRLAEVEHILGVACLQLAFAAAAVDAAAAATAKAGAKRAGALANQPIPPAEGVVTGGSLPTTSPGVAPPSRPTVAERAAAAASGRRPWGFGVGPFAEVPANMTETSFGGGGGGRRMGDDDTGDLDDDAIIVQLEDDGTLWPSAGDVVLASTSARSDDEIGAKSERDEVGDEGGAKGGAAGAGGGKAFGILLSKAILHLTRAACRARWGRSWVKTERSCGLLWNAILSLWLSPQDFRPPGVGLDASGGARGCGLDLALGEHHARIYAKACEALLDAVDAARGGAGVDGMRGGGGGCGGSDGRSNSESEDDDTSRHQGGAGIKHRESAGYLATPPDIRWVSRFVEWGLQGLLHCRCWGIVVKVGSRLLTSTGGVHGGHRVYPLILFAQKRLCSLASALLSRRQERLADMDKRFQEAQAKRNRRKVLKALETKSREEIAHERDREPSVAAVGDARVRKQIQDHHLGTLLQSRETYVKTKRIGRRALDDARESLAEHLALISPRPHPASVPTQRRSSSSAEPPESVDSSPAGVSNQEDAYGQNPGFDSGRAGDGNGPSLEAIQRSQKAVLKLYRRTVQLLREKRERELLAEALCDVGDIHVLTGNFDAAAKSWTDAIDSICSALDSTRHWRKIFGALRATHPSSGGPHRGGGSLALALGGWSCLAGGIVLGKLSAYTQQNNLREQLNLSLMAAEMFRAPLETSLPFPQRLCDYASFTPETLGGPGLGGLGLWVDHRRMSAATLSQSLAHVQGVLSAAGRHKEAFAVQAVLEYVASKVTLDPAQLVRAKLARAECLAEAGFPAEAASVLAGVLSGKSSPITTGGYAGRRDTSLLARKPASASLGTETVDEGKGKAKKGRGAKGKEAAGAKGKAGAGTSRKGETAPLPAPEGNDESKDGGKGERGRDPRDLSKSGLPFYGFAPYYNNLPLGHPENTAAVSWLTGESTAAAAAAAGTASTMDASASSDVVSKAGFTSRHGRLLKRGLFGINPECEELHGENEACLVARTRARLLLTLCDCSAMLPSEEESGGAWGGEARGGEEGSAEVLRRVRDAADCILGEVLQVVLKRVSPEAIPSPIPLPNTGISATSSGTSTPTTNAGGPADSEKKAAAAAAAHIASTAPDAADGWAPPMAADALLLRGRLAMLDGKLRVCRHHASRGMAVLLRHSLAWNGGHCHLRSFSGATTTTLVRPSAGGGALTLSFCGGTGGDGDNTGSIFHKKAVCRSGGGMRLTSQTTLADEQRQPWKVIQTWLELRHDLAVVALVQGRTTDAIFQIEKGLDEAQAVGEAVVSNRLCRLRAQAAVAEGELDRAVVECRALAAGYIQDEASTALDLAAVLQLLAKIRRQQSLVSGEGSRRSTLLLLSESLDALRLADRALLSAAETLGWIGSGVLTYAMRKDNIMGEDAKPRLLHALGTSFRELGRELPDEIAHGLAPADEGDEVAQTSLANLYFPALRLLLTVRVLLLDTLEAIGEHNPEREELELQQVPVGSRWVGDARFAHDDEIEDAGDEDRGLGSPGHKSDETEDDNADDGPAVGGQKTREADCWLTKASGLAEETLALLRHVAHPHPTLRAHLLLLVGKFRLRQLRNATLPSPLAQLASGNATTSAAAPASAGAADTFVIAPSHGQRPLAEPIDHRRLEGAAAAALTAALRTSFSRGGHDREVMREACMGLVSLYCTGATCSSVSQNAGTVMAADVESEQVKRGLACHYLRLAASISVGHRRLDVELSTIAIDPLPRAVVDNMPRSALDELAGRGGRGPEDDPLRLTASGLLQFLRAMGREKSLAAAPADLLPASVVCQIHALLYRHVPAYREKCCVDRASLQEPSKSEIIAAATSCPPGTVCVQWVWEGIAGGSGGCDGLSGGATQRNAVSANHPGHGAGGDDDDGRVSGLYPARTAYILLGPVPNAGGGENPQEGPIGGRGCRVPGPAVSVRRVLASRAEGLRRRAAQLKALLTACKNKAAGGETTSAAAAPEAVPPVAVKERFDGLLRDAARTLRCGHLAVPHAAVEEAREFAARKDSPTGPSCPPKLEQGIPIKVACTAENVRDIEGMFDTRIGVHVANEQLCNFLRGTIPGAKV